MSASYANPGPTPEPDPPIRANPPSERMPGDSAGLDRPEVRDWVARFRDPQGPPRIGAQAGGERDWGPLEDPTDAPPGEDEERSAEPEGSPRLAARKTAPRRRPARSAGLAWPAGIALVGLIAVAAVLMTRRNGLPTPRSRIEIAATSPAPHSPPTALPAPPVSTPALEIPSRVAPHAVPDLPTTKPTAPAEPAPRYGIEVATYINEERATAERARLAQATQLPCELRAVAEDGAPVYHLVLGGFDDRRSAERAGGELLGRGLIAQTLVVRLPRPRRVAP